MKNNKIKAILYQLEKYEVFIDRKNPACVAKIGRLGVCYGENREALPSGEYICGGELVAIRDDGELYKCIKCKSRYEII